MDIEEVKKEADEIANNSIYLEQLEEEVADILFDKYNVWYRVVVSNFDVSVEPIVGE